MRMDIDDLIRCKQFSNSCVSLPRQCKRRIARFACNPRTGVRLRRPISLTSSWQVVESSCARFGRRFSSLLTSTARRRRVARRPSPEHWLSFQAVVSSWLASATCARQPVFPLFGCFLCRLLLRRLRAHRHRPASMPPHGDGTFTPVCLLLHFC